LLAILCVAALQYGWNAWAVPPLSGYDAGGHAGYVLTLLTEGRLPHPQEGWSTFHPPVYYLIASGVWSLLEPWGPGAVVMGLRAIGGLALLVAAAVAFVLVRRTGAGLAVAGVATLLVLFVPSVQLAAAMIGNEALAAGFVAVAMLPILALQRDPGDARNAALAGGLSALAWTTKFSGIFVLAACAVPFLRADLDSRGRHALGVALAVAFLVAGPVYGRNLALTGTPFPLTRGVEAVRIAEEADVLRPRRVSDYLWLDPAVLLRPSIHHVADPDAPLPRRNPAMANVWGLAYASTWFDAFGHRLPPAEHRDGAWAGPVLALLGLVPTAILLLGFVLACRDALRLRGRSPEAPIVVLWLAGLLAFAVFTWRTPVLGAAKGSYLLGLAAPGAVFFAGGIAAVGTRLRRPLLALSAAAALTAAAVFTQGLVLPAYAADAMAGRWRLIGSMLPASHITEAVDRLTASR
jgi:hypothetical protein